MRERERERGETGRERERERGKKGEINMEIIIGELSWLDLVKYL